MPKDETTRSKQAEREQGQVILEDNSLLSKGFTQVPNAVLRDSTLSDGAKLTYAMLLSYAWSDNSSFPGQERLAEHLGKERKAVIRYIQELKNRKLVRVERRGLGLTNIYYVRTSLEADVPPMGHQEVPPVSHQEVPPMGHKEYEESKNTKIKNTKSFRKAHALKTEKGGEGVAVPARSHVAHGTIRNRKEEAETRKQKGRGVTFSPDKEGITNKRNVRGRAQQVTPTSSIPKSVQENTERGTNGHPSTANQTLTQKRAARTQSAKNRQPAYVGKPITQEEIDEKRRHGQNASGFTPLAGIIPASHWQELETRAAAAAAHQNGNGNGLHFHQTTKNAPDFIDALIEQFSKLLHDEAGNIPQNINRAAKLYRQSAASEELFITSMHDAYTASKRKQKIATLHSDGRPNKMPYFFSVLEDKLGVEPKQPN